ncbi:hypothetical protein GDO81_027253 [Engystomops pustulosus]|uniref:Uncharacterized protein n=1 Tax=Engystomops pustulosus TaxID=76066 RepID=A0AAV6YG62_ENGPU|nr:hypothetical protein GDO81_027253 [Engystomops pustulosus]
MERLLFFRENCLRSLMMMMIMKRLNKLKQRRRFLEDAQPKLLPHPQSRHQKEEDAGEGKNCKFVIFLHVFLCFV